MIRLKILQVKRLILVLRETLDLCNDVINFTRKIYGQN